MIPPHPVEREPGIRLPTANGSLAIFQHKGSGECSAGCGTKGGGMARFEVGEHRFAFCGNCVALAVVARIDAVTKARDAGRVVLADALHRVP